MSIATQITRISADRDAIRNKLVSMGMASSTDNLDALATAVSGIVNQGAVTATVQEGDTYTIPAGYHNGGGTVSGVSGGGNYTLEAKSVTPTTTSQTVTPDEGYYGLSSVTISAIPTNYADVSSVSATAANVLSGTTYVPSSGELTAGTMPNNGALSATIDGITNAVYTLSAGYYSGGTVSLDNTIESTLAQI